MMASAAQIQSVTESGMPLPAFLHDVERLYDLGCSAIRSCSYVEAVDCLSKALEMQVEHYGELAPECAKTYHKLGSAYLLKGQSEAGPLGDTSDGNVQQKGSSHVEGSKPMEDDDCEDDEAQNEQPDGDGAREMGDEEEEDGEEDDLEAAWKVLDIARVIYEKEPLRSLAEVDVLTDLADVSIEREFFQVGLDDYERALRILESLVEADSRRIAELCFKISLANQYDERPKEALEYCSRAVSICEHRVDRLSKELVSMKTPDVESNGLEKIVADEALVQDLEQGGMAAQTKDSISPAQAELEDEVKEIEDLLVDLREKLEEFKEMAAGPTFLDVWRSTQPEAAALVSQALSMTTKLTFSNRNGSASSAVVTSSSTPVSPGLQTFSSASSAPSATVTVVGRGVKRATPTPLPEEQLAAPDFQPTKKPTDGVVNAVFDVQPSTKPTDGVVSGLPDVQPVSNPTDLVVNGVPDVQPSTNPTEGVVSVGNSELPKPI